MTLVSGAIANLINGVSQQPEALRLASQGSIQENAMSSVVDGLIKRPPTMHVAEISPVSLGKPFVHLINRDATERYQVLIAGGALQVYDLINNEFKAVAYEGGAADYLEVSGEPVDAFKATTIADYTVVVNKQITVLPGAALSPARPEEGIIYVRAANYSKDYTVTVTWRGIPSLVAGTVTSEDALPTSGVSEGEVYAVTNGTGTLADDTYWVLQGSAGTSSLQYTVVAQAMALTAAQTAYPGIHAVDTLASISTPVNGAHYFVRSGTWPSAIGTVYRADVVVSTPSASRWVPFTQTATVTHTTPDGDPISDAEMVSTTVIAQALVDLLAVSLPPVFSVSRVHSTIHLILKDGRKFSISTEDGAGGAALVPIKNTISTFSDLPNHAPDGFVVAVAGEARNDSDDFYVRFEKSDASTTVGQWRETVAPGAILGVDPATAPHGLVRLGDGSFAFRQLPWVTRECGDDTTNPQTSLVNRTVSDVFFHRNRLGLLAGESVVLSRSGDFFNLYRETVQQVLDTDPIDIASTNVSVSTLHHAVPFEGQLVLFSQRGQFALTGGDSLTPANADLTPTTNYEVDTRAAPASTGRVVYFATPKGRFNGVREYYVDGESDTKDANDVTGHVPQYIPKGLHKMAASSSESILLALTSAAPDKVFAYQFFWSGVEKLQSAWHVWTFPEGCKVLDVGLIETTAFFTVEHQDGSVHLERMEIEASRTDADANFTFHLDRLFSVSPEDVTYDPVLARSSFALPWAPGASPVQLVVSLGTAYGAPGEIIPITDIEGSTAHVSGDITGLRAYCGVPYAFRYRFSRLYLRKSDATPVLNGRLQLRYMQLSHGPTGYLRATVQPSGGRHGYTYEMVARRVGDADDPLDSITIDEGVFRFPVQAENKQVVVELINDTFLPCSVLSAEWEGVFSGRSRIA